MPAQPLPRVVVMFRRAPDAGVADLGGADELVEGDLVGLSEGEPGLQAGAALAGP
ncbi:hypothetical protein [Streptomyces sp. NPDC056160]|uniref:hypothetical protein n=1 Tax=Streptomyces sp. NPDC056160 TaxID=3345731 RepID=UPI0035DA8E9D